MNYELLKNKIYLTLLAYYDKQQMPSFVQLGKEVGISRQTASTKFKELLNKELVYLDENDNVFINNTLNVDIEKLKYYLETCDNFNAVELKNLLFEENIENKTKSAEELNVSRASLYLDNHTVVYGIQSEGKIKYVGTTEHFNDRIQQHIKKRPFLTPANFLILKDNVGKDRFNIELELIHLLKPEWNK